METRLSGSSAAAAGNAVIPEDVHHETGSVSQRCWLLQAVPLVMDTGGTGEGYWMAMVTGGKGFCVSLS